MWAPSSLVLVLAIASLAATSANEAATMSAAASSLSACSTFSQVKVLVEGVGNFCVQWPACGSSHPNGACPGPQPTLPYGSTCSIGSSGTPACVAKYQPTPASSPTPPPSPAPTPTPTPTSTPTPITITENNTSSSRSTSDTSGATTTSSSSTTTTTSGSSIGTNKGIDGTSDTTTSDFGSGTPTGGQEPIGNTLDIGDEGVCGPDETPMSVEGVRRIFCVSGMACSGNIYDGACPGKQEDLPFGSACRLIRAGVYGCKPFTDESQVETMISPAADIDCSGNPGGDTPVSVRGVGTFCARQPVCSGQIFGNCPTSDSGLPMFARCDYVATDVWGCVV
ncbi:TPA: hypothetical protein N0F65_007240 [Lagenidium giganteum]|uniref:Uncharacterized protein n=1 Tax=Lagenidium giganteum TaxID=4803 RepID=A0AAV2Z7W6_9STRA|nr:TPA: hypothetical protein N0F65_007240 [Lagenidium giganteum]